jgi:cytosolic carboxypeptidase protein 2/3
VTENNNECDILTITNPCKSDDELLKRRVVIFSARVHPCESQSSFMIKGAIDYLTSSSEIANELRNHFVFKVIPMLNPDGVIAGNSRVS